MEKIIRSSDVPTGNLNVAQLSFMRDLNLAPTFDRKEKSWKLIKIPKSTTKNVAWHVRFDESDYMFIQICGSGQSVSVFSTDSKGKDVNYSQPIKIYNTYVDLESAVDKFYNEEYEQKIASPSTESTEAIEG